jgi:hypothetical protein
MEGVIEEVEEKDHLWLVMLPGLRMRWSSVVVGMMLVLGAVAQVEDTIGDKGCRVVLVLGGEDRVCPVDRGDPGID